MKGNVCSCSSRAAVLRQVDLGLGLVVAELTNKEPRIEDTEMDTDYSLEAN